MALVLLYDAACDSGGEHLYVNAAAASGGDGLTWNTAYNDLQTALGALPSGYEVWIAAGVYRPHDTPGTAATNRGRTFSIANGTKLYGGFNGSEGRRCDRDPSTNRTILSGDIDQNDTDPDSNGIITDSDSDGTLNEVTGNNSYHVVTLAGVDNTTVLDGLTITGGLANGGGVDNDGAGMYATTSSMVLGQIVFSGNLAVGSGGGAHLSGTGNVSIANMIFSVNMAGIDGGGLYNDAGADSTLTTTAFIGNRAAGVGAGAFFRNSTITMAVVAFLTNVTSGTGGGLHLGVAGTLNLDRLYFLANIATLRGGGASCVLGGQINVSNSVFQNNVAGGAGGGGIDLSGACAATLRNVTLFGNQTPGVGGGLRAANTNATNVYNSIYWGNTPALPDFSGAGVTSWQHSIVQGCGDSGAFVCENDLGNNLDTNPLFLNSGTSAGSDGDLFTADDGLSLQASSPARNSGSNSLIGSTVDITSTTRILESTVDRGAYEYQN
ncbi:MAG: hypothetical protein KDK35_10565 [Leptospiraceae bacterium]|nr:hypothetical protein [Leptospiraceae bacterium]